MDLSFLSSSFLAEISAVRVEAFVAPSLNIEVCLLVGAGCTLLGTMLHWRVPHQRMAAEERMKDGKLTAERAARMIWAFTLAARVFTVVGAGLLIVSLASFLG